MILSDRSFVLSILPLAMMFYLYGCFGSKVAFGQNNPVQKNVTSQLEQAGFKVIGGDSLKIESNKPIYKKGEAIELTITPAQNCRLTLLNIDSTGDSCLLFPHPQLENKILKAGQSATFPPKGRFFLNKIGTEHFLAFCNSRGEDVGEVQIKTQPVDCSKKAGAKKHSQRVFETVTFDLSAGDLNASSINTGTGKKNKKEKPAILQNSLSVTVTAQ